jgi:hypothetical protein
MLFTRELIWLFPLRTSLKVFGCVVIILNILNMNILAAFDKNKKFQFFTLRRILFLNITFHLILFVKYPENVFEYKSFINKKTCTHREILSCWFYEWSRTHRISQRDLFVCTKHKNSYDLREVLKFFWFSCN